MQDVQDEALNFLFNFPPSFIFYATLLDTRPPLAGTNLQGASFNINFFPVSLVRKVDLFLRGGILIENRLFFARDRCSRSFCRKIN